MDTASSFKVILGILMHSILMITAADEGWRWDPYYTPPNRSISSAELKPTARSPSAFVNDVTNDSSDDTNASCILEYIQRPPLSRQRMHMSSRSSSYNPKIPILPNSMRKSMDEYLKTLPISKYASAYASL